jgi:hypothetical protein
MSAHPKTDLSIPKTQKVAIFEKAGGPVHIVEKPVVQESELEAGQVLVKVMYSGYVVLDVGDQHEDALPAGYSCRRQLPATRRVRHFHCC